MKSEKEAEEYVQNMVKVGQGIVQEFVDEAMRHGQDCKICENLGLMHSA